MNIIASSHDREVKKFIHLLYAPTNFCNMGCQYCYLGTGTDEVTDTSKAVDTLKFTLEKCLAQNIVPFNLSFHGGEATTVPKSVLKELFSIAQHHYEEYGDKIKQAGFPLNPLHIKTNLYNFDKLYDLFDQFCVSISGSVDLPLSLHEKYRTDKKGRSTLAKIKNNLALLARYPHHKKISCVVTREHMSALDEFIADIKMIHYDIGLDMSKFNIMFSFDSEENISKFDGKIAGTEMLTGEEQVIFYRRIKQAFVNTELEHGLHTHWFKEFTPEFCCSSVNCGDKFFLLQSNGDVYACPRGQSSQKFLYGNVFNSSIDSILVNGWQTIEALENKKEPCEECYTCNYLPYCNQGCVFVREETQLSKSYTCELQKEIYRDNPQKYPAFTDDHIARYSLKYRFRNNITTIKEEEQTTTLTRFVTPELYEDKNALASLIAADSILEKIYSTSLFKLHIDGQEYCLQSPILTTSTKLAVIKASSKIELHVDKDIFSVNCKYPVNNTLQLMFLRNTMVTYGDEDRTKQEHILDYNIYQNSFFSMAKEMGNFYILDISDIFKPIQGLFIEGVRNNLYITTKTLRDFHYEKQKNNAFYHIQAINLPFPYFEFYCFQK